MTVQMHVAATLNVVAVHVAGASPNVRLRELELHASSSRDVQRRHYQGLEARYEITGDETRDLTIQEYDMAALFPNIYTHRKVADTASKACDICYKPSTSVLVTPENKVYRTFAVIRRSAV